MIVATAGHIDHGKTALVKALTGVDADRLPEEKARGITVDLGFAYADDGAGRSLGFVDVPGHEALVRTMVAGATGVDFVMLVVAADDGIMPQTREHLAILDLLGIARGVAVISKTDRADPARVAEVSEAVQALLAGTTLSGCPVIGVSAQRGAGIDALRLLLADAAAQVARRDRGDGFRLAIDRSFTLAGIGLVVTGSVHAGAVAIGDRLVLAPRGQEVRVRGIHAQNEQAERGRSGQRCALNIAGARLDKNAIGRGDWVVSPPLALSSSRLDARLLLLPSSARSLRHWTPVHVHLGAADIPGRIGMLEGTSLEPGQTGLVRLVLDRPASALGGDRFVIRDQSARMTLGGGQVIDPLPPPRQARTGERLALLRALDHADDTIVLTELLAACPHGIDLGHLALVRNMSPARLDRLLADRDVARIRVGSREQLFAQAPWQALCARVLAALHDHQQAHPDSFGITAAELGRLSPAPERPAAAAALEALVEARSVVRFGQLLQLPGHVVTLTLDEENLWTEVAQALLQAGIDPPRLSTLAERLQLEPDALRPLVERFARMGRLRRISPHYFILPDTLARLAVAARACAQTHAHCILTVGQFREATAISRHAVMPVMEFLDRIGFTRRHKDGRRLRPAGADMFEAAPVPVQVAA